MLSSLGIFRAVRAECCLFQSCGFKSVCNGCGSHGANAVVSWDDIQSCVFSYSSEKEVCVFGRILGAAATQSRCWKSMGSFTHEQGFEDFCLSLSLHTHQNCNL